jgi:rod shape-determining protein MreD
VIRYVVYALSVAASLVLQTTWLARASIGGAVPDPLLILVMATGLLHGPEVGMLLGAGIGLLQDVVTGVPLGLGMLACLCVGFAAGLGERIIYMENVWLPALGAVALSALKVAVWTGAAHLVGLLPAPPLEVVRVGLLTACYNGVIAVPIFHGLRYLDGALIRFHEGSR